MGQALACILKHSIMKHEIRESNLPLIKFRKLELPRHIKQVDSNLKMF